MADEQVQGQPNAQPQEPDLNDIIKGISEGTGAPPAEPPKEEPKPISVNLMGQQYQFKDEAELSAQLTQYVQGLQQQVQQVQQAPSNYVTGKEDDTPQGTKWTDDDMKEYVRLMGTNPIQAQNYLDKKRLGVEDPVSFIKQTAEENQRLNRSLAAIQFRDSHPDLQLSPQVAAALEQRRSQLGVPFTYNGLEASYWSLVGNRVLPPPQSFTGAQPQQPQFQRPAPPPSVPRSAPEPSLDYDVADRFEQMSKDDLARVLTEYQMRTNRRR